MKKSAYLIFVIVLLFSIQCLVFAQDTGADAAMLKLVDSKLDLMIYEDPILFLVFENTASVPMVIGYEWDDVEDPSVTLLDDVGNELEVVHDIETFPSTIMHGEKGYAAVEFWNIPEGAKPVDYKVTFTGVEDENPPVARVYMDATVAVEYLDPPYNEYRGLVATVSNPTDYPYFLDDGYIVLLDQEGKLVFFEGFYSLYGVSIIPGNSVKTLVREIYDDEEFLKAVDYEKSIIKVWFDINE
ncbi:MAG: hypothetical protein GX933_06970 [Chloroflexi bacterium]|nr:hypothetical protein [Chloroflexota bacterium]